MERWPFILMSNSLPIKENKFYAFDEYGTAWSREGYASRQMLIEDLAKDDYHDVSTKPEDLGAAIFCVLFGREFVDRLNAVDILEDVGAWSPTSTSL